MVKKTIRRGTCIVLVILMLSSALWYTNEVLKDQTDRRCHNDAGLVCAKGQYCGRPAFRKQPCRNESGRIGIME